ncbi:hypothetical protein M3196_00155 [Fictibacillus nanhaiensis]|uniref:hypothetical protein n=1 Tax=Fictibacillus nanhaiensis TaxID=742169 RepID=UPI002041BFCD|nr:hypothetical protein [Fictibacillus nanhaiensis]MCM3730081.1 hypothetical protein [Fictibacillus nanhaiensis]
MSSQKTTNLNLHKWIGTDNVKRIEFNENWDTIDAQIKGNSDKTGVLTNLETTDKSNLVNATNEIKQESVAHKADYVKHSGEATTTNSSNAYSVTLSPAPTSYVNRMGVVVTINADSTGAATLNVNGIGAKKILKANGTAVSNLKANGIYTVRYNPSADGGTGAFILQGEGASGNAIASDLLSGKTATTDAGEITGSMVNRGAMTITPGTTNQVIPDGFHNGSGIVLGDPDLIAANILSGKNIFNVAGSLVKGKGYATGIAYLDSSYKFTVSGLAFTPSIVIAQRNSTADSQSWYKVLFKNEFLSNYQFSSEVKGFGVVHGNSTGMSGLFERTTDNASNQSSWTANGFTMFTYAHSYMGSGIAIKWWAFE